MSDVSAANQIIHLFSELDGLTREECDVVANSEGWSSEQCEVLIEAMGAGPGGEITSEEQARLLESGFHVAFVGILRGTDGLAALRRRVSSLEGIAERTSYPLEGRLEALAELQAIYPSHPTLRSLSVFLGLAADADTDVRVRALEILSGAAEPSAIPTLREALHDPEPRVRGMAARALGAHGSGAEPALRDLIDLANHDEEDDVRERAVRALGSIGLRTPEVVSCLLERATDPDPSIRRASITATVRLTSNVPEDVSSVLGLSDDPDRRVRETVDWALRRFLADPDPTVQAAAREALERLVSN